MCIDMCRHACMYWPTVLRPTAVSQRHIVVYITAQKDTAELNLDVEPRTLDVEPRTLDMEPKTSDVELRAGRPDVQELLRGLGVGDGVMCCGPPGLVNNVKQHAPTGVVVHCEEYLW